MAALVGQGVVEALDATVVAQKVLDFAAQHAGALAVEDAHRGVAGGGGLVQEVVDRLERLGCGQTSDCLLYTSPSPRD